MLTSIGIVLLCGLGAAFLAAKLQLPRLVGMIAVGETSDWSDQRQTILQAMMWSARNSREEEV